MVNCEDDNRESVTVCQQIFQRRFNCYWRHIGVLKLKKLNHPVLERNPFSVLFQAPIIPNFIATVQQKNLLCENRVRESLSVKTEMASSSQ